MNDDAILKLVKLREIAEINPKHTISLEKNTLISFVAMSAVSAETASTIAEERYYGEVSKGYTPFVSGDILVAKITPCFENGKIAQAKLPNHIGFGSTEFHVVRPRLDRIDTRYLLHFLRQESIRRDGARKMTGSAGQRRVPQNFLANLEIRLPPLKEQQRIAEILDRAESLRAKRREAIAQLNTLTQSIFLEMFGDPISNPKGFPIRKIKDLLESASYGTSEKSSSEGKIPVLRMNNITRTGEIDLSDLKYMDLDDSQKERYLVHSGDVLFNRTNSAELVGKTAIIRNMNSSMAFAGYLVRLRVNKENDPEYLSAFLNTDYSKRVLRGMCKSIIGMANINATEVQTIKIAQPPLHLQQEFAHCIEAVEKLKTSHRRSLAELDALFASLQHRAFRGEL